MKFQKKSVHLYTWVNRLVCNIFDMIHSSNSVLKSGGVGCIFFWKIYLICDIVCGLFHIKLKQHMISTDSIDSITKIPIKTPFSTPLKHLKLRIECRTIGLFCRTIDFHSATQFPIFGRPLSEAVIMQFISIGIK